ncbi:MAG: ABC transporter, substrate-binding protein (cluster 1, maltose/g3p/polyamine/iron) [uncultured Friedmanniella sp.]|uniref:ABC transporter, substrate-binding protein (Cluster 1, maltose/g3p/polyamine/iron) n=1 Tax=uncultured Friedmanniella sp. TaxID=335381 RepID=A0A6J4L4N1_9ACTN|nr:MAG: ABC transporter, substrate-binding protein (cluster 1, maltose/g3p/polyamine/iron) [uncultured Friedmanniella sp.]
MSLNRRQFLAGSLAAAAASAGLSACSSSSGSGGDTGGSADLAFAWWGNDVRNKNTADAVAAYTTANPTVKISQQPGEWASYWDKLATQTAGNTAPDIIQMDVAYISEYGSRGALLDLEKNGADVSKFAEGTVDSGKVDGQLVGINAGVNAAVILANPEVFEKAGMDLPDDTTWTWDSMMEIASEVAAKADVPTGVAAMFPTDVMFAAFLRQNGKELWQDDQLGFEAADAQSWFDLMVRYQDAKAMGTPSAMTEESTKPVDQAAIAVGTAAMQTSNSNQLEALSAAAGTELKLLRFPSLAGQATERKAWYKASMLYSASARSKDPEAAVAFINWLVNSPEAANANLAERGIPANTEMAAAIQPKISKVQQTVAKFIADIEPELAGTLPNPPAGGGTLGGIMLRYETDVLFGKSSTAEAAQKFVDEVKSNLTA